MSSTPTSKKEKQKKVSKEEIEASFPEISSLVSSGKSQRQACVEIGERLGIDAETLRNKFKRWKKAGGKHHGNRLFLDEEEEGFVGLIQGWSLLNRPLSGKIILEEIKSLYPDLKDWNGESWLRRFTDRHESRFSARTVKGLKSERVSNNVTDQVQEFVSWFEPWFAGKGISHSVLINADETRVQIEGGQHRTKVFEAKSKTKASALEATRTKSASYIPFHTATGKMIMSVFVLPIDKKGNSSFFLKEVTYPRRGSHPTFYAFTETGWLNSDTWLKILETLQAQLSLQYPGLEACLLLDNLSVHMTSKCLKFCKTNKIHVAFFPANSTHFLQPSDDKLFTNFKKLLYSKLGEKLVTIGHNQKELGALLVGIAQDCENMLTPTVIKASWRDTGIYPWDSRLILERAKKNSGSSSSSEPNDTPAIRLAREATMSIIKKSFEEDPKKKVKVRAEKAKLFSGEEILQLQEETENLAKAREEIKKHIKEQKKMQKEAEQKRRDEEREKLSCRGTLHSDQTPPSWKGSKAWKWCETCESFGLCGKCTKVCYNLMLGHEEVCSTKN